jgi:RNA recognition motif-containing protein
MNKKILIFSSLLVILLVLGSLYYFFFYKKTASTSPNSQNTQGTVYIEGISYDADDDDLKSMFEQVGPVVEVRMPRWNDSKKPKGYAHLVFKDAAHVKLAIDQLNGQRLMGRYLKVALPNAPKAAGSGPESAPPDGRFIFFL